MKNLETGNDLKRVAIHEVAHAIVGVHHGLKLHMVDLYEEITQFKPPFTLDDEESQELYLAGIAAESLAGYPIPPDLLYISTDWASAMEAFLNTFIPNATIMERDKQFLLERWSKVESLAALLLKQGYLDRKDVGVCP